MKKKKLTSREKKKRFYRGSIVKQEKESYVIKSIKEDVFLSNPQKDFILTGIEIERKRAKQEEKERLMTKFRYNSREFHNEFTKWDLKKKHGLNE